MLHIFFSFFQTLKWDNSFLDMYMKERNYKKVILHVDYLIVGYLKHDRYKSVLTVKLALQFELPDAASVGELNRVGFNGGSGGVCFAYYYYYCYYYYYYYYYCDYYYCYYYYLQIARNIKIPVISVLSHIL